MSAFLSLHSPKREFSSAGSEHLPYKQRVGGSIPSTPTKGSSMGPFSLSALFPFVSCASIGFLLKYLIHPSRLTNWDAILFQNDQFP